jgi:hypothetical protein
MVRSIDCMFVRPYERAYGRTDVRTYVRTYKCTYVRTYVRAYVRIRSFLVRIRIRTYTSNTSPFWSWKSIWHGLSQVSDELASYLIWSAYVRMYVRTYVRMYVRTYVRTYAELVSTLDAT